MRSHTQINGHQSLPIKKNPISSSALFVYRKKQNHLHSLEEISTTNPLT